MTDTVWTELIKNAPYLAANIVLVFIFINYLRQRDKDFQGMLEAMDKRHADGTGRLAEEIKTLAEGMREHDQYVREHFGRADGKGSLR